MEALTSEQARLEFEQTYQFHSMRSYIDEMYRELDACDSREEYDALLETCSDYLEYSEGRLIPRVSSAGYQRIADESGVFYVGDVKHTVKPGKVLIETIDPVTRAVSEEAIEYEMPFTLPSETRDETVNRYTDVTYQIPGYKVFSRTHIIRNVTVEIINGQPYYHSQFDFQVHMSSQKNKTLIGWNSYKTRFQIERVHFDVTIEQKKFVFANYNTGNSWNSDVELYDYYLPVALAIFHGGLASMPIDFKCIVHRVHTNATGDCGCLTHMDRCKTTPYVIKECR